jgi:ArsR family transcriptional regulator
MRDFMTIAKALSDKNRIRMLLALSEGELCVCQITELVGLSPSTVSKHMSILRQARLVEGRKDGRWLYYRYPGENASEAVRAALHWVRSSLNKDPVMLADAKRLKEVLSLDPEKLCRRQNVTLNSSPAATPVNAGDRGHRGSRTLKTAG